MHPMYWFRIDCSRSIPAIVWSGVVMNNELCFSVIHISGDQLVKQLATTRITEHWIKRNEMIER